MPATALVLEISLPFFFSLRPGETLEGGCDKVAHEEAVNDISILIYNCKHGK